MPIPARLAAGLVSCCCTLPATPVHAFECADLWSALGKACTRIGEVADHGGREVLFSGYAHHLANSHSPEKLATLNEKAWGLGYARTLFDADGDSHTVAGFVFHSSHRRAQWNAAYLWQTYLGKPDGLQVGGGLATMIVQRSDVWSGVPFPAAWPFASLRYGNFSLYGTYFPPLRRGLNMGSVAFVFGGYRF